MGDRVIPSLVPGRVPRSAPGGSPTPPGHLPAGIGAATSAGQAPPARELDLRRTAAPEPMELPPIRLRHLRRYAATVFDHKGRLTCSTLFDVLGWEAGTSVDITASAGTIVVCRARGGEFALTGRRFLHVPSRIRRWCSFGERELVLVRAVPESSALLIFGQEKLDQSLPQPRRLLEAARAVGGDAERPGDSVASGGAGRG